MQDHGSTSTMAAKKKRFVRINDELVLIRETHRSVLEWMRFEGQDVQVMSLQLSAADLGECAQALGNGDCDWTNPSGTFAMQGKGEGLELVLQSTGINASRQTLQLDPAGRMAFYQAIHEFIGRH